MDNEDDILLVATASVAALVVIVSCLKQKPNRRRTKRSLWTRPWLQRRMQNQGTLHLLNEELKTEDPKSYRNFLRLDEEQFKHLLRLTAPLISKKDTVMRESIPASSKLEVTLRFLATGETFRSLMYGSRIHESTISRFIPVVCQALIEVLRNDYLKMPTTIEEWKSISTDFHNLWQFPQCLGALDGRHITFSAPISEGSYYYNYKGTNSIVLLALVDATYKFRYVNIGVNGRISDGGVFNQSSLGISLKDNMLNIPPPEILPGQSLLTPYVIIADDAFPSLNNLIKPYSEQHLSHEKRIYNYRLSRARRMGESSFGILANRFRVLLNPINLSASKVEIITLTCVLLHNYLATHNDNTYTNVDNESYNSELQKINRQAGNRSALSARQVRDNFKDFFNSHLGSVSWQENSINTGNY